MEPFLNLPMKKHPHLTHACPSFTQALSLSAAIAALLSQPANAATGHYLVANGEEGPVVIDSDVVQASSHYTTLLYVKTDGTVWQETLSASGADPDDIAQVSGLSDIQSVHVAMLNKYYLKSDGTLLGSGDNTCGQLGLGSADTDSHDTPVQIATDVTAVYPASYSVFYVTSDGSLYGLGDNACGQIGNNSYSSTGTTGDNIVSTPYKIAAGNSNPVVDVYGFGFNAFFLRQNGALYGMGVLNFVFNSMFSDGDALWDQGVINITDEPTLVASSVSDFAFYSAYDNDVGYVIYLSDGAMYFKGGAADTDIDLSIYGHVLNGEIGATYKIAENVINVYSGAWYDDALYYVTTDGAVEFIEGDDVSGTTILPSGVAKTYGDPTGTDSSSSVNLLLMTDNSIRGYGANGFYALGDPDVFGDPIAITDSVKLCNDVVSVVDRTDGSVYAFLADSVPVDTTKWDSVDGWGKRYNGYAPWYYSYVYNFWYYMYYSTVETHASEGYSTYWVFFYTSDASDYGWCYCYTEGGMWCYLNSTQEWSWVWWGYPIPASK
jgi:hypothetical protein